MMPLAAGVDVGGTRKGFHVVILRGVMVVDVFHTTDCREVASRIKGAGAAAVGVDAPCRWRQADGARAAERRLAEAGIHCFSTPTAAGAGHPFYAWMRNGMALYRELESAYQLFVSCFETFPHAVACALAGRVLRAGRKRADRRMLLEAAGIDTGGLSSIDFLDAALCALAIQRLLGGRGIRLGDEAGGFIVVPRGLPRSWSRAAHPV